MAIALPYATLAEYTSMEVIVLESYLTPSSG
jgi:hypothetical protein